MKIQYIGKGYAVVMGKALFQGQSREVPEKVAVLLLKERPTDFEVFEEEPAATLVDESGEQVEVPAGDLQKDLDSPTEIDPVAKMASLTVDEIRALAPDLDAESARRLIEAEQAGKARKSALEILQSRLAELEGAE